MTKEEKIKLKLYDYIECVTSLGCSNCNTIEEIFGVDADTEPFYELGWRATEYNCYCPECAKKKLKIKDKKLNG